MYPSNCGRLCQYIETWSISQKSIENRFVVHQKQLLEYIEDPENDQLAPIPCWFETFNVNDVNTEYWVKDGKFLFNLIFIQLHDIVFRNNDLRTLDVNKMSIMMSKFIIFILKASIMDMHFSGNKVIYWQSFAHC